MVWHLSFVFSQPNIFQNPVRLYAWISLIFGLVFCFVMPPLNAPDEPSHFLKTVEVSEFYFLGNAEGPCGLLNLNGWLQDTFKERVMRFQQPWDVSMWKSAWNIPLQAETRCRYPASIHTPYHPLSYLVSASVVKLGVALRFAPLAIVYLTRLTLMFTSWWITLLAIRCAPSHQYVLAFMALLPTALAYRSGIGTDPVLVSVAYLFSVLVFRLMTHEHHVTWKHVLSLTVCTILIACVKNGYVLMPFIVLLLPKRLFSSTLQRWQMMTVLILPAVILSVAWLIYVKLAFYQGYTYIVRNAEPITPDAQLVYLLREPWQMASAILRTIFATPFLLQTLQGFVAEIGQILLHLPHFFNLLAGAVFGWLWWQDSKGYYAGWQPAIMQRVIVCIIFTGTFVLAMSLLYLQWTPLKSPIVLGFQGRYFYPLLPMLFFISRARGTAVSDRVKGLVLASTSISMLGLMVVMMYLFYYSSP